MEVEEVVLIFVIYITVQYAVQSITRSFHSRFRPLWTHNHVSARLFYHKKSPNKAPYHTLGTLTLLHESNGLPGCNGSSYSLAYEEHVHRAEVELIEVGQRRKAIVGRMLAGIKLEYLFSPYILDRQTTRTCAYHDCFAFILNDVTGPSDLIPAAKTEKH